MAIRPSISVLILDDEAYIGQILADYLLDEGHFDVHTAQTETEALDILRATRVDVCLLDLRLQGADGFTFVQEARARRPSVRFLIHTGSPMADVRDRARVVGLAEDRILLKPVPLDTIARAIERVAAE